MSIAQRTTRVAIVNNTTTIKSYGVKPKDFNKYIKLRLTVEVKRELIEWVDKEIAKAKKRFDKELSKSKPLGIRHNCISINK